MRLKPQPLPTPKDCPVCRWGKRDPVSIANHNLAASATGERSYTLAGSGFQRQIEGVGVSRIGND
jgi:hypothetical protein